MSESTSSRNLLGRIFISPDEPRFRAGWRLLLYYLLIFLITGILVFGVLRINQDMPSFTLDSFSLAIVLEMIAIIAATWIARRFFDRRSFTSLGLKLDANTVTDLLMGFFIPALVMGLILLIEWAAGWLTFDGFAWQTQTFSTVLKELGGGFIIFIMVAISEEILSRGYHLQNITEGTNLFWGLMLSSVIFSFLHLGNPNSSFMALAGLILAGFFLAFGWLRTRQLWLPIGLHLGWNFFEGPIFGFPVSGLETFHLIRHRVSGPTWITGGSFGPEAGAIIIPAMALGIWLMVIFTRGRTGAGWDLFETQKLSSPPDEDDAVASARDA